MMMHYQYRQGCNSHAKQSAICLLFCQNLTNSMMSTEFFLQYGKKKYAKQDFHCKMNLLNPVFTFEQSFPVKLMKLWKFHEFVAIAEK